MTFLKIQRVSLNLVLGQRFSPIRFLPKRIPFHFHIKAMWKHSPSNCSGTTFCHTASGIQSKKYNLILEGDLSKWTNRQTS